VIPAQDPNVPDPMRRHGPLPFALALALCLAWPAPRAFAERADRDKPTNVEADRATYDDLKQVTVFTGNVVLTKGTIMIRGDRLVLRQDPDGFQFGTATGRPATFRQKRDGVEQWIDGQGEELEYDGRDETVRLVRQAKMRRTEGSRVVDDIEGALIVYDSRTEQFNVEGGAATGPGTSGGGRVRVTIQPRTPESAAPAATPTAPGAAAPGAAAGVPLKPAPRLAAPRPVAPAPGDKR
jgi:lipopolysaccharide export system protein LptA